MTRRTASRPASYANLPGILDPKRPTDGSGGAAGTIAGRHGARVLPRRARARTRRHGVRLRQGLRTVPNREGDRPTVHRRAREIRGAERPDRAAARRGRRLQPETPAGARAAAGLAGPAAGPARRPRALAGARALAARLPPPVTRVAAVDLGTNSTRLLVADVHGDRLEEVVRRLTITKLGEGVDERRRLLPLPI